MNRKIKSMLAALCAGAFLISCEEQGLRSGDEVSDTAADSVKTAVVNVSGKLFSIPSPVQTAKLIQDAGVPYNREILSDVSKMSEHRTKSAQAMNLGVYGTDMAYASLYEDGQSALKYFKGVDRLSSAVGVRGAINPDLVKRLGGNVGNPDSLLMLSGKFYREADNYLKENDRIDIAAYVLLGGWVEATYLTAAAAASGTEVSRNRLAEQKMTVKTLREAVEQTADQAFLDGEIMTRIYALEELYGRVKTQYTFNEAKVDPEMKRTVINSTSVYEMDDELMDEIYSILKDLRKTIAAS